MQSSSTMTNPSQSPSPHQPRKLMLFDLYEEGHHPGYILHLIRYWLQQEFTGQLDVVVTPRFIAKHTDVVAAANSEQSNVRLVGVTDEEAKVLAPRISPYNRAVRSLQEWRLLNKYAALVGCTDCLMMYFDSFQTALLLGKKAPCNLSGIYFRPTFHYPEFTHYSSTLKDKVQVVREHAVLPRVLNHPSLKTLFCLDRFALNPLLRVSKKIQPIHLPDPVQTYNPDSKQENFKRDRGIDHQRKIFLLFGTLDGRKGIYQLLDAIQLLPFSACEQLCLWLVGPTTSDIQHAITKQIDLITQILPVQIVVQNSFVQENEIQPYFQCADVILAPYQRHVGMSAILVRAAAAQKPVLSSNFGLMGQVVDHYELGLTVDSTNPDKIATALVQLLQGNASQIGDHQKMLMFAQENSAQEYAKTIFSHL
jgi:glycosyltransferase involved in cell wall biosynthesis